MFDRRFGGACMAALVSSACSRDAVEEPRSLEEPARVEMAAPSDDARQASISELAAACQQSEERISALLVSHTDHIAREQGIRLAPHVYARALLATLAQDDYGDCLGAAAVVRDSFARGRIFLADDRMSQRQ